MNCRVMMNVETNKSILSLIILFALPFALSSQTKDYATWSTIVVEKSKCKWDLSVEGELRTRDYLKQISRTSIKFELAYAIVKLVKIGASYEYMSFYDAKYSDFQPRQRYSIFIQGKQDVGRFSFSLRERFQRTIKNEGDRIKETGVYDTYKVNPEWIWRNKIKAEYNISHSPITPAFSFETFYQLNNPDGNVFDQLRFTLSFGYKINKQHKVEIYGLINKEINVDSPVQTYVAGLAYTFSF